MIITNPTSAADLADGDLDTAPADVADGPGSASVDLAFAARAATYLRNEGLDRHQVAGALCAELGLSPAAADRLAGG